MRQIGWADLLERWPLLVADFHHLLGIDLEAVFWARTWRWFEVRVGGILAHPESLLGRAIDQASKRPAIDEPTNLEAVA